MPDVVERMRKDIAIEVKEPDRRARDQHALGPLRSAMRSARAEWMNYAGSTLPGSRAV